MSLNASFIADFSSFMSATSEATRAVEDFKQSASGTGPTVDSSLEATKAKYVAVAKEVKQLGMDIGAASKTFIQAYTEEQDAVAHLTAALAAQGKATPQIISQYADLASQFQKTTVYADEAITGVEATLTTIGKVGPENMALALSAVTNLASGMKIDLATAADLVARALATGGENLGKLKTVMGDTIKPGQEMATTLGQINDKFSGSASADIATFNGMMAQLNNQFSNFRESVGGVLVDTLSTLLGVFQAIPEPIQKFLIGITALGTALAPVLLSLQSLITILSTTGVGAALGTALGSLITILTGPVGLVVAVGALAAAVYKNWDAITAYTKQLYADLKYWLADGLQRLVAMVKAPIDAITSQFAALYNTLVGHSIVPDTINGIADQFGRLNEVMVQPTREASDAVVAHLALMQNQMRANAILNRNSLFTTSSQLEEIARLPLPFTGGGGGGGGAVTINNTFNIVDTADNIARQVSDIIMRQVRSGTQLGTA